MFAEATEHAEIPLGTRPSSAAPVYNGYEKKRSAVALRSPALPKNS
jgi:hypothetical protein